MQKLTPWIQSRFYYKNSSTPLASGLITFYVHNSTIFAPTFATKDGVQNPNPVPLDVIGQAQIWLSSAVNYDIEIRDKNGAFQESILNVSVNENGSVVPGSGIEFVTTVDTDSIAFQGLGTTVNPLSSDINVSAKADNALEIVTVAGEEGAYVADVSSDLANKLDKVDTAPQSVASTVDFDGGILVGSGYFGATSPNIVFDASATSYILDNPNISLTIRKQYDNSAEASLTMAKATSVDGVASLSSNGAGTSYSNMNLFSGSATTPTYQQFTLENADGGTIGTFVFTGSGLDIENASSDGSAIKMPNGSWIRPQTENASLYFTNGLNPSDIYSSVHLNQGQLKINGGDGVSNLGYLQIVDGQISLQVVDSSTGAPKDSIVLGDGNIELIADGNRVQVQNNSMLFGDNTKTQLSFNNTTIELLTQANSIYLSETNGLKIDIPSKGANKVLTSDVNGFATWQTPTGGGSGDLQDAYDNGELITTDATNGAVTIKRGSALDTDKVLSIEKGDGTEVLSVTGEGATEIDGPVTINTSLLTTPNLTAQSGAGVALGVGDSMLLLDNNNKISKVPAGGIAWIRNFISIANPNKPLIESLDLLVDNNGNSNVLGRGVFNVGSPGGSLNFNKNISSSNEFYGTNNKFNSPIIADQKVTLNSTASETPIKTLGRNALNEIIEFNNVVGGGQVDSVVAGTDITITGTATDPIVNAPGIATNAANIATNTTNIGTNTSNIATNTTDIAGKLDSVVAGTNVTIDNTDPINPIINATGGSGGDLQDAYDNSTSPEITTDATNGALTLKRGSALDADNVLEVKNGAGTTTASVTGDGESTFTGDMTLLNTKNGTWTVDESIRRLNFYSSDTSGSGVGNVGWIDTRVTTTFGTGCDMVFGTAPSGGEATESMRLSRLGDLTAIGDGTFGGTGSFGGSTNIDNVLASTSATFYKKDGFNNWATGVFNASNDFNIFLYDKTTGAYSSSFIKLTHNTNQIQLQKDTIVSGSIIQGGVTDTGEGLQGTSLSIDGDVTLGGIVDATPTKALGLNASDEVVSYAVNVPRVTSVTSTATLTIDSSTTDQAVITAQSGNLTIASPTGSPVDGQKLIIRVKAVGTSVITWNAIFRQIGTTLPTPTTAGKTIYVACIYNSLDTKWDVVAVAEEA